MFIPMSTGLIQGAGTSSIYSVTATEAFASHNGTSISRSMSLGTDYSDREIWIVVISMDRSAFNNPNAVDITGVTVGGNSASSIFQPDLGAEDGTYVNNLGVAYWKYVDNGALGSSATVSATFSDDQVHSGIIVFTTTPSSTVVDTEASRAEEGTSSSKTLTSGSGWSFYCAAVQDDESRTVDNFANDDSFDMGTDDWVSLAYNSPSVGSTTTVSMPSGSYNPFSMGNSLISAISVE